MKKKVVIIVAAILCVFFAASSQATDYYWMNPGIAGNYKWNNATGNWGNASYVAILNYPKTSSDAAYIYKVKECIIGTDMTGATKAVAGTVKVGGIASTNAFLTIKGQALFTSLNLGNAAVTASTGTLRVDPGAALTVPLLCVGYTGTSAYTSIGTFNMQGGTATLSPAAPPALAIGTSAYGNGIMTMNGGTVSAAHQVRCAWGQPSKGTLTVNNGAFLNGTSTNTNMYFGAYGLGELTINSGGKIKTLASLQVGVYGTPMAGTGHATMNGGTLEIGAHLYIGNLSPNDNWMQLNNDANVTIGGQLKIGDGTAASKGRLTMTGTSKVTAASTIILGSATAGAGSATIELQGGTLTGNTLTINSGSALNKINITGGVLIVNGDARVLIDTYVYNGRITAYGGAADKEVKIEYNITTPGKTRVWAASLLPPPLFTSYPGFNLSDHIISTSFFTWYSSTAGQISGPWLPLEGRSNWTGEPTWWKSQIKQVMAANIEVLYVHLILEDSWQDQKRINLFQALYELRMEGYNVPKVAPFMDATIIWNGTTRPYPDLATTAGKNELVNQYIRFFQQYYSKNTDAYADSYLATVGGKVVLDTWHINIGGVGLINYTSLSRADVESRLQTAFAAAHPVFNNGIYMVTTAFSPTFVFADEKVPQFEVTAYFYTQTYNGITAAQLKGGYWDQNVRTPGSFLARGGGANYTNAWTQPDRTTVKRVYIESWNEYDEGSGIYAVDVVNSPYKINGNPSNDVWSSTNDPYQYIKTTAAGARIFNDRPDRNSSILWHNFPTVMRAGEHMIVKIIFRNEGDMMWNEATMFRMGQHSTPAFAAVGRWMIDNTANEVGIYGGVFRGRDVTFQVELIAPTTPGQYATKWSMLQEGVVWFGQELTQNILVY